MKVIPAIALSICFGAVAWRASDEVTKERQALQGSWRIVEAEMDGKQAKELFAGCRLVFSADKVMADDTDGKTQHHGTFKLFPRRQPKAIDLIWERNQETRSIRAVAIYRLDNDRLTICMSGSSEDDKNRPGEFKTTGKSATLFVLERLPSK